MRKLRIKVILLSETASIHKSKSTDEILSKGLE